MIKKVKKTLLLLTAFLLATFVLLMSQPIFLYMELVYLDTRINMIAKTEASDISSCEIIAYGSKACGGPSSYLIYSSNSTNKEKLQELVDLFNKKSDDFNVLLGLGSLCDITMPPRVIIEGGQCETATNY